jgi:hypothetical protein
MPSFLVNRKKQLAWSDFQRPAPAGTTFAAATDSSFSVSNPTFQRGSFQLNDSVTVTVVFNPHTSWRLPEMVQWPAQLQQELLEHEQGHYDITALVARDLFIHLMQLKGSNYPNAAAGQRDFVDWVNMYQSKRQKIQTAYDAETGHSQANVFVPSTNLFTPPHQKGAPQIKWEGLIASAFTTPRPSGELAPDKAPYKVELEDVLIKAGISLP